MPIKKEEKISKEREKEREKEKTKEQSPSKAKEKHRHKSTRSTQKATKASTPPGHSTTSDSPTSKRRASLPEARADRMLATTKVAENKVNTPYPSFSKAHSKEAVGSRENVIYPRTSYLTPDPTDLTTSKQQNVFIDTRRPMHNGPPSPPETTMERRMAPEDSPAETPKIERKRNDLQNAADELKRRLGRSNSGTHSINPTPKAEAWQDNTSIKAHAKHEATPPPRDSKSGTPTNYKSKQASVEDARSSVSVRKASSSIRSFSGRSEAPTESTDSDATSVAPVQDSQSKPMGSSSIRVPINTHKTADAAAAAPSEQYTIPIRRETPAYSTNGLGVQDNIASGSPLPPPPPPAPQVSAPRVDYLMKNGGLPREVPRSLLDVGRSGSPDRTPVERFFGPLNDTLDNYTRVVSRNGSLAVATGYRSVARRLLDRLEAVFARDISSEICTCALCQESSINGQMDATISKGVNWGEILEYVCGRQEMPQWPPFLLDSSTPNVASLEQAAPMQKLDIDVPEEFRAHYIRQSKKTKQSVDRWLQDQPANPSSPPQDVDDETLTFAMLTRLERQQRPLFKALLGVATTRPPSIAPSLVPSPSLLSSTSELLPKTGIAIQRLYRLPRKPRDPECAIYLLSNPHLHNMLATLAAISDYEWDILISGRFDGFLRSGADDVPTPTAANPFPVQFPSRGPTPSFRPSSTNSTGAPARGVTPFNTSPASGSQGAPVTLDEETEIAVLAEIEREIYLGMETLEDAFEALHQKAETVRSALRQRGAGLAQASQRRRCDSTGSMLDGRLGTPASPASGWPMGTAMGDRGWESGTDDGIDDLESELAPDDSASNISRSRVLRPKRRTERRTPAPVEEEDEDGGGIVKKESKGNEPAGSHIDRVQSRPGTASTRPRRWKGT